MGGNGIRLDYDRTCKGMVNAYSMKNIFGISRSFEDFLLYYEIDEEGILDIREGK